MVQEGYGFQVGFGTVMRLYRGFIGQILHILLMWRNSPQKHDPHCRSQSAHKIPWKVLFRALRWWWWNILDEVLLLLSKLRNWNQEIFVRPTLGENKINYAFQNNVAFQNPIKGRKQISQRVQNIAPIQKGKEK